MIRMIFLLIVKLSTNSSSISASFSMLILPYFCGQLFSSFEFFPLLLLLLFVCVVSSLVVCDHNFPLFTVSCSVEACPEYYVYLKSSMASYNFEELSRFPIVFLFSIISVIFKLFSVFFSAMLDASFLLNRKKCKNIIVFYNEIQRRI